MTKSNKPLTVPHSPVTEKQLADIRNWLSPDNLEQLLSDVEEILDIIRHDMQTEALTPAARRRMLGSGVRRYGFIDKTSDVAAQYPEFAPAFFNSNALKTKLREIELLRNLSVAFQQMLRITDDVMLQVSDEAFQEALAYYNTVGEAAKRRQPGAQAIFRLLQTFFRRGRRPNDEPTDPEVERDLRALLHGRKDGKIVVEAEQPHIVAGQRIVADETHKAKATWKETEKGEVSE